MAHKRPFDDEVVDEGSSKHQRQDGPSDEISLCNGISQHQRQDGPSDELSLCNGSFSIDGACGKPYVLGDSSIENDQLDLRQEHANGSCPVPREDVESDAPRSASLSHWATSRTSDDELSEEPVQLPLYPGYFSFDNHVRPINPEDVYYCLLDYPPRKRVPVGPDHQADIPSLEIQIKESTSDDLGKIEPAPSDIHTVEIVEGGLDGICIMPIPNIEPLPYYGEKVGNGRTECTCPDQGSVRCVRQHIAEARDELRRTLGQDIFVELGFYDMGEVVAEKWSLEEEQLFHEVVYSNPASLGKNFWNVLSAVFPSRTKMEIVSYYFNVFMLRKRAEQNRCDSFNVDSDDDEWHGSDDDGGDEGGVSEEDEDSGIESPVRHGGLAFHQNGLHLQGDEHGLEDDGDLSDEARENDGLNGDGIVRKSDHDSSFEHPGKKSDDDGENDVQDGSCTSSDSGASVQGSQLKPDGCHEWNEYIIDSSDAKVWDGYSMSCPKQNMDFLSTCSMIEEVFGDGGFESKGKRW
ncbi:uncharacterized protein LOC110732583 [Chenopodium quinoa]|uniref:uncharacterized protein LOC110732583 n=1 Tax=Chenopodium quinoa TaxID=63459 RepID=UPI000B77FD37|nr:uncharacterized protein LOC110732583 [Chenopodium quinoa]